MKNLMTMFLNTAKSKVMPLWTKFRLWTSVTFLRTVVLAKIRMFFSNLLNVKPRHKRDYFPAFRWLISKRLAIALTVGVALLSAIYILSMLPKDALFGGVRTYKYRSLPLKFCSGEVNILARDGHLAYTGQVEKGAAEGKGRLFTSGGDLLYEGSFSGSRYEGEGVLYYRGKTPRYSGSFTDNQFNGVGSYFRGTGVVEYMGDYVMGVRTGRGILYNSVGEPVYEGSFLNDEIVYQSLLEQPTGEVAKIYTGKSRVYRSNEEFCMDMPEIGAVCAVEDGSDKLENEWTVNAVYVLSNYLNVAGNRCETVNQLSQSLGQPLYYGAAVIRLPEAVAINALDGERRSQVGAVEIRGQASFDEVFDVTSYDLERTVYLYTYEREGLLYTFYTAGAGESRFLLYQIAMAR